MTSILVTGGAGYIGSHAVLALLQAGHDVCVIDNLSNGSVVALERVQKLTGKKAAFFQGDIRDPRILRKVLSECRVDSVLHFAGLKAVAESVRDPLSYYENNVNGTLQLCQAMADVGVFRLVFSSSATVYGDPVSVPLSETSPMSLPTNPYGRSKLIVENLLQDLARADKRWRVAILRYFNPIGAHVSGQIGEDPNGIPNNLLPYVTQVAIGRLKFLQVFGDDYPTPDGTGLRDYIHVTDLVAGHICALKVLDSQEGLNVWNLGTGKGHSVLDIIRTFERVSGRSIAFTVAPRRDGDVAKCWADPSKAWRDLGWKADRDLEQMLSDAWRWQLNNPSGYSFSSHGVPG